MTGGGVRSWLRARMLRALDLDRIVAAVDAAAEIGVDAGPTGSTVVVLTRLHGGRVEILSTHFEDLRELEGFVAEVRARFGAHRIVRDMPAGWRTALDHWGGEA